MTAEAAGAVLRAGAIRPMLDPAWTPRAAYGHAQGLLAALSTEEEKMANRTPNGKRTRELLRALPPGLRIEKVGRKAHPQVLLADGTPLRDERGMPVRVAGTSTTPLTDDLARIRRALAHQEIAPEPRS